mgnify:FL=1|jgi:NADH:ubiquinone oxidoreductase subunit E
MTGLDATILEGIEQASEFVAVAAQIREALREKCCGQPLSYQDVESVAEALGLSTTLVHASMATEPDLTLVITSDVRFTICVGECTLHGSFKNLQALLEHRKTRVEEGKMPFDIETRGCLDRCLFRPSMLIRSPDGYATKLRLKPEELPELITSLCDSW